jgi:N-carbamoyl-L-amino-acid hydrolase
MPLRHDAGLVAAQVAVHVRELSLRMGGRQLATVGALRLSPNLVNVIAQKAVFTVDLRNTDRVALAQAEADVQAFAARVAEAEGVRLSARSLARFEPVAFDARLVDLVAQQAQALGCTHRRMPSGAGHDAQMLARVCPSAMIFVPSAAGLSHNVREHTEPDDLVRGAQLLLQVVVQLANRNS